MASTRLTNSIKEALTHQLLDHAFTDRSQKLLAAECALGQEVYDDIMDNRTMRDGHSKERTIRALTAALPAGWRNMEDYFNVEFAGTNTKLDKYDGIQPSYGQNKQLRGIKKVPPREQIKWSWPPNWGGHGAVAVYDANHEFSARALKLQGEREDLLEEISSAKASARATMDSVTTVQKLIVIWPEIEAFASAFFSEEKAAAVLLPVIARERLNDALGLPPGAVA